MYPTEALRQAVLGAASIQSPASPLGASQAPELGAMYQAGFQLPQSSGASSALAQTTQDEVAAQEAAARAAAAASSSGGGGGSGGSRGGSGGSGKFRIVQRSDGGFGFYAPDGSEISASDYSQATGKDLSSVLKNSRNPVDRAFLLDYKQLNSYINDKLASKNDPKARSRAQSVETQVRKLYNIPLHQQTPDSLVQAFISAYPTVFGGSGAGKQGLSTLLPSKSSAKSSGGSKYSLGSSGR